MLAVSFEPGTWKRLQSPSINDSFEDQVHTPMESLPRSFPGSIELVQKTAGKDTIATPSNHSGKWMKLTLRSFSHLCMYGHE